MVDLRLGDCVDVLKTLPDRSVGAIITDPPYGLGFAYNSFEDTRENVRSLVARFMPEATRVARRVYITPGQTQISLYPDPTWVLSVQWDTTGTFGKYGYSQWMPVLAYGDDMKGIGSVNGVLKSDLIRITGGAGVGFMRGTEKNKHPCPKPLNVMRLLVRRFTMEGEIVLDPFMGTGTTCIACMKEGRKFVGIEIDPEYYSVAEDRVREERDQYALFRGLPEFEEEPIVLSCGAEG